VSQLQIPKTEIRKKKTRRNTRRKPPLTSLNKKEKLNSTSNATSPTVRSVSSSQKTSDEKCFVRPKEIYIETRTLVDPLIRKEEAKPVPPSNEPNVNQDASPSNSTDSGVSGRTDVSNFSNSTDSSTSRNLDSSASRNEDSEEIPGSQASPLGKCTELREVENVTPEPPTHFSETPELPSNSCPAELRSTLSPHRAHHGKNNFKRSYSARSLNHHENHHHHVNHQHNNSHGNQNMHGNNQNMHQYNGSPRGMKRSNSFTNNAPVHYQNAHYNNQNPHYNNQHYNNNNQQYNNNNQQYNSNNQQYNNKTTTSNIKEGTHFGDRREGGKVNENTTTAEINL